MISSETNADFKQNRQTKQTKQMQQNLKKREFGSLVTMNNNDQSSSKCQHRLSQQAQAAIIQPAIKRSANVDYQEASSMETNGYSESVNRQHHVGAVMGIFSKVLSFVKVTKLRHQHKNVRRQNSEDTSQFRYISGEQLDEAGQRKLASTQLQDGHFRRAGSQPAASSSGLQSAELAGHRATKLASSRLHVYGLTSSANSNTTSTSSGVSSSSRGSTLANESQPVGSDLPPFGQTAPEMIRPSWQAKIRRSATSVNQTSSRSVLANARFRLGRSEEPTTPPAATNQNTNQNKHRDQDQDQDQDQHQDQDQDQDQEQDQDQDQNQDQNKNQNQNQNQDQNRDQYEKQKYSTNFQQASLSERRRKVSEPITFSGVFSGASDADNDSNDIYSTPNDSIQSVPSSGGELQIQTNLRVVRPSLSRIQLPMVKSFSTSNFKQLGQHHPLLEEALIENNFSLECQSPIDKLQRLQTVQLEANRSQSERANKPLSASGSRFFISSSSSEDSSSPPQPSLASRGQPEAELKQASNQSGVEQADNLRLKDGIHHHERWRPDYLALPTSGLGTLVAMASPSAIFVPKSEAAVAAMSPLGETVQVRFESAAGYRKSPSLFEMSTRSRRLNGKNLVPAGIPKAPIGFKSSLKQTTNFVHDTNNLEQSNQRSLMSIRMPTSISLYDCKEDTNFDENNPNKTTNSNDKSDQDDGLHSINKANSEYKLARMLLELGSNPKAKDPAGCTALMHAVLGDNLPTLKCLVEHGVDINETNYADLSALDLICSKSPTKDRLEMLKFLIDNKADFDRMSACDGSRLLDRLIGQHKLGSDKLPYIECLLQNGAKMGSSTWLAAFAKFDIQLSLLKKLCQDGYFLYKKSSIEAAVYRFEYALKRLNELEQQISSRGGFCCPPNLALINALDYNQTTMLIARQIKYQAYLGLSRCERKRKFYKRALEFAQSAILVDSNSYEGFYSKAHILKDLGDIEDSLLAIDQTARLVDRSIESQQIQFGQLEQQIEEAVILGRCFEGFNVSVSGWIETRKQELSDTIDYLCEAKRHIARLKSEIIEDKLATKANTPSLTGTNMIAT